MESCTTLTVSVRPSDGNWSDKKILVNSSTGITLDTLKKQLDISLKDSNLLHQNNDGLWQVVENDKDLGNPPLVCRIYHSSRCIAKWEQAKNPP
jgi:hypothetical protein